ncbi:MAG: hypothetical protein R3E48_07340 [Burkholderiaceae bacterium]
MKPMPLPSHPRVAGAIAAMVLAGTCATSQAVDLGQASVQSQQGQRLKVAIPFGSAPGERVPVTRFSVVTVQSLDGAADAPDPRGFTISKPERRNVVFLQSRETVIAPRLRLVVAVSEDSVQTTTYELRVPPQKLAAGNVTVAPQPKRRPSR